MQDIALVILCLVALRHLIGIPPIAKWKIWKK